jgi:hypothetical protein
LAHAPGSFGLAISQVDIYAHVQDANPPLDTLEAMYERFQSRLQTLPRAWFKRKRQLFEIAYFSQVGQAEELLEQERPKLSVTMVREFCSEIVSVLSAIKGRLRREDDFDYEAFDLYLQHRLDQLPNNLGELSTVLSGIKAKEREQIAARRKST